MDRIRQARPEDLEALYRISLLTGHLGGDAGPLYDDPRLMGHIYSAPYLIFSEELALVVEREGDVMGYCVGTADTRAFEAVLEAEWWPPLRATYPRPLEKDRPSWTADARRCHMLHVPEVVPDAVAALCPAHLHMNMLPAVQRQGIGGQLLEKWMHRAKGLGVTAAHVGANINNAAAVGFWTKQGFAALCPVTSRTVWLGRQLD